MEALIFGYFFTEYPNCELANFGFQFLNVLSNLAFLAVAYLLYQKGGKARWLAFLVVLSSIGSFVHHLWPLNETVPFDVLPALIVAVSALLLSVKNLTSRDLLIVVAIGLAGFLALYLDIPLCDTFPLGTHFLWHFLAAYALFLLGRRI